MVIIGIDVGGSLTKAIVLDRGEIAIARTVSTVDDPFVSASGILAKVIADAGRSLEDITSIGVSGGKSRQLSPRILGIELERVGEIEAIGLGGIKLANKSHGMVVSAGTGTAIVRVTEEGHGIEHVGGTGVGGGTLIGLCKAITGTGDVFALQRMAKVGDSRKVDLTVGDIVGSGLGLLNAEATASNFGKMEGDATREDLVAAVFKLVGEVIGEVAYLAAAGSRSNEIVMVGALSKMEAITSVVKAVLHPYKLSLVVPPFSEYGVAVGAASKLSAQHKR